MRCQSKDASGNITPRLSICRIVMCVKSHKTGRCGFALMRFDPLPCQPRHGAHVAVKSRAIEDHERVHTVHISLALLFECQISGRACSGACIQQFTACINFANGHFITLN